jgi:hypothetical protein
MTKLVAVAPRGRSAARLMAATLCLGLALTLTGCGETNPLNPNPQPTPTPTPARANVTLTLTGITIDTNKAVGFAWALVANLRLNESAGVAATIDYIRLDLYLANNTLLERTQLSGSQIPGGNALSASGVRDFPALALGFNQDPLTGRYIVVSVATTDARGNAQVTSSGQLIFG